MNIGERIVLLREKKGWKQKDLADKVNINVSVMNRIEKGSRPLSDSEIIKISKALEVTTDQLLGISDTYSKKISIAGKKIDLSEDEKKVFEELKKYPILFNDLTSNPESKVKELIKLYKVKKILDTDEDDESGNGFGSIDE
ncbi:helix-turn-helix transcriptional regulator [Robertmurraya sp. DFI.2.37]|uniref:helix-turn-helix domain-containing protein n=1 Tax=Robertmurraya sp. DFI.2.37 TaxID=3031819 RepID=UPI0012456177|nr:helix-turn-helix transcriptional regulator [Robertmurraya sp. DFI.2.37]MDF1509699.1 helix-turn-helix transcriptional regulator [Robertmurraya sp. DFI.2.37]